LSPKNKNDNDSSTLEVITIIEESIYKR